MAPPRPTSLTTNIRIPARQLVVEPRVRLLPRHRRSLLRRLEPPHRPALDHHVHRPPGLGQCMTISAGWYKVPVQPLLLSSRREFAMFPDLQRDYHWVLPTHHYDSQEQLIADLRERVIRPAEVKVEELRGPVLDGIMPA